MRLIADQIFSKLKGKSIIRSLQDFTKLINIKGLLMVILALFSLEGSEISRQLLTP